MASEFDVLIIGAGPAGSFAAERLARGGARVALFDGRPAGDAKACGGGVTSKALKAWPFLHEAGGRTVSEVEMYAPAGGRVRLELEEPFVIYSRRALDSYLCERARAAGAEVFEERVAASFERDGGGSWTVRGRGGESWRGRVLVAADGANSPVAKRLAGPLSNSEMEVAFGYRTPLNEGEEAPTVIAFLPGWAGYAWAFPRLDHISFGITSPQLGFKYDLLDRLLWDFMLRYYCFKSNSKSAYQFTESLEPCSKNLRHRLEKRLRVIARRYAARIPKLLAQTWDTRRVVGCNWALLGDAAGFVDPVTDEGIYYAMRSAELWADACLGRNLEDYEEFWREDFGANLCRAATMRRRFYGNLMGTPFTTVMINMASIHGGVRRTLSDLVTGNQSYIHLKRTLAKRALWPF